jgi:hypothetical protein
MLRQSKVLGVALFLAGCATPYKSNGLMGGFSERQLSSDTFVVSFQGNGFTQEERARDFLLLRCADLTLAHGAKFFRLSQSTDTSQTMVFQTPSTTTATGTVSGNNFSATTTTTPGVFVPIRFPHQTAVIQLRQDKEGPQDIDAALVSGSIRAQYDIR